MSCVKFGASKVHFLFSWIMLLSKDLLVCMYVGVNILYFGCEQHA